MRPKVSILIPMYNQTLEHLTECISSCLAQNYENLEIIVSDNHSTNGAGNILRAFDDVRLTVVSPATFQDMNGNFAFCASQSSGDYVSFLSSDDMLVSGAIEVLVDALEQHAGAAFAFGNVHHGLDSAIVGDGRGLIRRQDVSGWRVVTGSEAYKFFFPWKMRSTWLVGNLIRRSAYLGTGGFSKCDMRVSGDVWLTRRLLENGGFVYTDRPLALFRARSVGHVEVDPNRRLNEFIDSIQFADGLAPSRFARIRQIAVLLYRVGAAGSASTELRKNSVDVFRSLGRADLATIAKISVRWPRISYFISIILSVPKRVRDQFKAATISSL